MFDQPFPQFKGRYCVNKDLQSVFNVSRATIDRWCRERPGFPKKIKLGPDIAGNSSTRFLVEEVVAYLRKLEESAGINLNQ